MTDAAIGEPSEWTIAACPIGAWPGAAVAAVSVTFDFDAETSLYGDAVDAGRRLDARRRLSPLSDRSFGATRGVPRLLDTLDRYDVRATFFVPGRTALVHREAVGLILERGHEIGHHGMLHRGNAVLTRDELRAELEGGLDALERSHGCRPRGYRAPLWEATDDMLDLLVEYDLAYDSSMMGDDRPYRLQSGRTSRQLLEFPVHWSLDDYPFFPFESAGASTGQASETWCAELESAYADGRHVTYTFHPEVSGRGYRVRALEALLDAIRSRADMWVGPLGELCTHMDHR